MLKSIFNAVAVNGKAILFATGIATIAVSSVFLCGGCSNLDDLLNNIQQDTTGNPGDSTITPPDDPCVDNPNGPDCQTEPIAYTLTIAATSGGTVSPAAGTHSYADGATVNVTATATSGYEFTGWTGTGAPTTATTNPATVTMNANKTLTANFQIKDVTPPEMPATLIWDAETGYRQYDIWFAFSDGHSFTNPAENNDFHSNFVAGGGTVIFNGRTGNPDWVGVGAGFTWVPYERVDISDHSGVWITYSLAGSPVIVRLGTVLVAGGESLTGDNDYVMEMPTGTNVRRLFRFSDFRQETGWGVILPIQTVLRNCSSLNFQMNGVGTASLTVKKIEWDEGTQPPTTYTLTIAATSGGTVSPAAGVHSYADGASVTVTATANSGYTFKNWSGASTSASATATITMNANKTLTANFEQLPKYTITFNANGGNALNPGTAATGTDGKLASLPTPTRTNYTFKGWWTAAAGGDSVALSKVYSANTTIYAHWAEVVVQPVTYTLTIAATSGGTVSPAAGTHSYADGATVNVTTTATSGYEFTGWTGTGAPTTATTNPATVTMNANKTLTANFQIKDVTPPEVPATLIWDAESGYHSQSSTWFAYNDGFSSTEPPEDYYGFDSNFVKAGGKVTYTGIRGSTDGWVGAGVGITFVNAERVDISNRSGVWVTYSLSSNIDNLSIMLSTVPDEGGESLTGNNNYKMPMPAGTNVRRFFHFSDFSQGTGWGVILPLQTVLQNCSALNFEFSGTGTASLTVKKIEWDASDVR